MVLCPTEKIHPGEYLGVVGVSLHFEKKTYPVKILPPLLVTESQLVLIAAAFLSLFSLPLVIQLAPLPQMLLTPISITVIMGSLIYFFSKSILKKISFSSKITSFLFPSFSFEKILSLWLLMIIALLAYGIGTYFIVTSFTYLTPLMFWAFVGYFVLSLLAGFVSFITPTGLGVREGAIALGLGTVMSSSLAAFIAIAARGVLILSELLP